MHLFAFLLTLFPFSVLGQAELSCTQHFQKMYSLSTDKNKLANNLTFCIDSFNAYLKNEDSETCPTDVRSTFCRTLLKDTRVENYEFNPLKEQASLQLGYALGMGLTQNLLNWISPPLEIPPPTTQKRKENAQKKMTESECLYQTTSDGATGFQYEKSSQRCFVTGCQSGYVMSDDHSICIFQAENECLKKNASDWQQSNKNQYIVRWGYVRNASESADCYIAQCVSGYAPDTYGQECEPIPVYVETRVVKETKKETATKTVDEKSVGDSEDLKSYQATHATGSMSDNFNVANSYSFRGTSSKTYPTTESFKSSAIPDGSPLEWTYVSSMYGMRHLRAEPAPRPHKGIDLRCSGGEAVRTTADGTVTDVRHSTGGCGNSVQITHTDGQHQTRYCHLQSTKVSQGQKISRGHIIGLCGNTGYSFGAHLHYEIKSGGFLKNPIWYLTGGRTP